MPRRAPLHAAMSMERAFAPRHAAAFVFAALSIACGAVQPTAEIGIVDLERAITSTRQGQAARDRLRLDFEVRQRDLDERSSRLRAAGVDLEGGGGPIRQNLGHSCDELMSWVNQRDALQRDFRIYQEELQNTEQAATQSLLTRLRSITEQLADERGITIVFDREGYAAPAVRRIDLTDEVVRRYDAQYPLP
jgi:Skp family chaperone for outer membrane proteins